MWGFELEFMMCTVVFSNWKWTRDSRMIIAIVFPPYANRTKSYAWQNRMRDKIVRKSYVWQKRTEIVRKSYAWKNRTEIIRVTKSYGNRTRDKIVRKSYARKKSYRNRTPDKVVRNIFFVFFDKIQKKIKKFFDNFECWLIYFIKKLNIFQSKTISHIIVSY